MTEKPKLIVSSSGKGEPIYYLCSYCSREFSLSDNLTPKEAAKRAYDAALQLQARVVERDLHGVERAAVKLEEEVEKLQKVLTAMRTSGGPQRPPS